MVPGQLGCRRRRGRRGAKRVAGGGLASVDDRDGATRTAPAGGQGVRRRGDLLSPGERDRVSHAADRRPRARAKVDTELAAEVIGWGALSVAKVETAIDYWVDRYDPLRVRRTETRLARPPRRRRRPRGWQRDCRRRGASCSTMTPPRWKSGSTRWRGRCAEGDPRTIDQRRADALGAMAPGGTGSHAVRLTRPCAAARAARARRWCNVIAEEASLADDTPVALDGEPSPGQPVRSCGR